MYGIVGQKRPGDSDEQIVRDTFVRDALLALASGDTDALWPPVTTVPTTKGIGNTPSEPSDHAKQVLEIFTGIDRP